MATAFRRGAVKLRARSRGHADSLLINRLTRHWLASSRNRIAVAVVVSTVLMSPSASAATLTWGTSGTGGSGTWSAANAWWTGAAQASWSNAAPDDAVFAGASGTVSLTSSATAGSLTFNSFTGTYTIGTAGTTLTLGGAGLTMNSGAGAVTLVSPVTLSAAQSWTNNSSSLLTGSDAINNGGFLFTAGGSGSTTLAGAISGGGGLTKSDAGTLTLSGSNAYSGVTTLSAGQLNINNAFALGSGNFTISGGTMDNTSAAAVILNTTNAQNWNGNFTFAGTQPLNLGTGAVTMSADRQVTVTSSTLAVGGVIGGGAFKLTKAGAGTLTLTGSNTFTGPIVHSGGVLEVASISDSVANALGLGPWLGIANATLRYTGATSATTSRILYVDSAPATFDVQNAAATLTLTPGVGSTVNKNFTKAGAGTLVMNGVITGSAAVAVNAGTLRLSAANTFTGTAVISTGTLIIARANSGVQNMSFPIANNSTVRISPSSNAAIFINAPISGSGTFVIDGPGGGTQWENRVVLGGASSPSTNTGPIQVVNSGKLWLSSTNAVAPATAIDLAASATLALYGTGTRTVGGLTGSGTVDLSDTGGGTPTLAIGHGDVSSSFGGVITDSSGSLPVAKIGSGTLALTGTNTYSGATRINAGTLLFGSTSSLYGGGTSSWTATNITTQSGATAAFAAYGTSGFTAANLDALRALGTGSTGFLPGSSFGIDTTGTAFTYSSNISNPNGGANALGLTKFGSGTLTLSGSNTYTGNTTISAGVLSFSGTGALAGTPAVRIAGGAGLTYTGAADTFGKNITVVAGSGTGTVRNSGGGLLTLSGTLSKDNSVLRLTGGSFNVTGLITGTTVGTSDLLVDGTSTVTLSSANTYDGPTFVNQASNLIVGINNAIPSNSLVTLGDATTTGTLTLGTYTNAIGGLAFGAGGGTLRISATSTSSAPLTAATGTMTLTNGTLDLAGSGSTAGLYRVLSAQSIAGSFTSVNGTSAAYQIVTTSTSVDYQQRAVLGTLTVTNPATAIITGGSAAFTYTVTNTALSGGDTLSVTGTGASNVAGSSAGSAAAAGTSSAITGLTFTGTSVGSGQTGTFTVNAATGAFGTTTATGTVSVNVYAHAAGSAAGTTIALPDSIVGYTGTLLGLTSATISNASGYRVDLMTTGGTSAGFVSINNVVGIGAGTSGLISASALLSGAQSVGTNALGQVFNLTFADDSALSGKSTNLGGQSITVTGKVLDHATSSLGASLLTSTTISLGTWNYASQTWESGTSSALFAIYNLASSFGANLTAGLSLTGVSGTTNGFSTNLGSYADISGGQFSQYLLLADPASWNTSGKQTATFTLQMSDQTGMSGATASNTLHVTASVIVVPEPGSLALAAIGALAAGWVFRRRGRRAVGRGP